MTTEPEVPLSAEERGALREELRRVAALGPVAKLFTRFSYQNSLACLVTLEAQDVRIAELEAVQRTCICTDSGLCAYHDEKFIRPLEGQIAALQSLLRDANRRAFDLNNELGATQNAAQAERVELEARVRQAEGRIVLTSDDRGTARRTSVRAGPTSMSGPADSLAAGWGDARLPELTARFGHPLNDDCEYASQCVVGALLNAEECVAELAEKLAHVQECREAAVADLMRQRTSLEEQLWKAKDRIVYIEGAFFTQGVRDALQHFYNRECGAMANHEDVTRAAAAILWHEQETALQSAQKENEPK